MGDKDEGREGFLCYGGKSKKYLHGRDRLRGIDVPVGTLEIAVLVTLDAKYESTVLAFRGGHDRVSGESAEFEKSCLRVETEIGMQQGVSCLS